SGGSGGGPDHDRDIAVPDPPIPTVVAHETVLAPSMVAITGYQARARTLTIDYTVHSRECSMIVVEANVSETPQAVTVQLERAPSPEQQFVTCPKGPFDDSVDVSLAAPVGNRVVRDAAQE